jgi:hypothetical protein
MVVWGSKSRYCGGDAASGMRFFAGWLSGRTVCIRCPRLARLFSIPAVMPGRVHDPARFTVQGRTRQRPVVEGRHGGQRGCRALRLMLAPGKENAAPAGKMGSEPFYFFFPSSLARALSSAVTGPCCCSNHPCRWFNANRHVSIRRGVHCNGPVESQHALKTGMIRLIDCIS